MNTEITLNVKELKALLAWLTANEFKDQMPVKISVTTTGIGPHVRASVQTSEHEGRFINLTDYDSW